MFLVILPCTSFAAEEVTTRPYWSLEIKGGRFIPEIENWSKYYGERYSGIYGASLGYKIIRQLEIGVEGSFSRDSGQGFAPLHGVITGNVTHEVAPLNAFVLIRAVFTEGQWLVPYVGGGWTRMFYKQEIQDQGVTRGSADGTHARAGLQLLLDKIDPSAATSFYLDWGVEHTYLFIEAERIKAAADALPSGTVELGGTSWLAGFLFEF